jgi:hypothetical protein
MKKNLFRSLLGDVGSEIVSCLNCQPYEDGEPVWMDHPTCLDDLFDSYLVPDWMRRRLAASLRCRNCNNQVTQYDIVGTDLTQPCASSVEKQRRRAA